MTTIELKASSYATRMSIGQLEHPNRMPFAGVLTYLNRLSTEPPHGANGLRVVIPTEVGTAALTSLKGMAVNYAKDTLDRHDPQSKIGVITEAYLGEPEADGAIPINIEGYIYALDFEDAAVTIKASQEVLGFSYETAKTRLSVGEFNGVPAAVVSDLGYFTGATILLRDKASYRGTSIAASAYNTKEDTSVDLEKLLADLKEFVGGEIKSLREEFSPKEPEVVEEITEPVGEPVSDTTAEEVVEPVVEEEAAVETASEVESTPEEASTTDQAVTPEGSTPVEQPEAVTEEAMINASAMLAEIEALKAQIATLTQEATIQASARKSVAYPVTLAGKFNVEDSDDKTKLMASIDARTDLSVEERLALKFEAKEKLNKQTN